MFISIWKYVSITWQSRTGVNHYYYHREREREREKDESGGERREERGERRE